MYNAFAFVLASYKVNICQQGNDKEKLSWLRVFLANC